MHGPSALKFENLIRFAMSFYEFFLFSIYRLPLPEKSKFAPTIFHVH